MSRGSGLRQKAKELALMIFPCTLAKSTLPTHRLLLNLRPTSSAAASCFAARMSSATVTTSGQRRSNDDVSVSAGSDLESIFKQKKILRSKVRKSLKEMNSAQRSLEDDAIQQIVLEAPWFKSSKRLCAYISCSALREVDTSKVLAEILQNQAKDVKKLYVPRVEDKNSHMRMLNISSIEDLIANSMNILEPGPIDCNGNQREDVMKASEPVDIFLLPGLAFDRSGRRLGRGGGYYDTFLRNYQNLAEEQSWKQPLLVALAYSVQILDGVIPVTPNDVFIDALVSPSGVIPISAAALRRMEHDCNL
ncbi:5-formyltetrahydrofolate cyclo-ligase, mitochondrial [Ancistrocladus abbreviatus]